MFGKSVIMLFKYIFKNARFVPVGLSGLFIVVNFIIDLFTQGMTIAGIRLAKSVFAAELVINTNVHLAISNSPQYGIFQLLEIFISILILWTLVKWIAKTMIYSFGANENFGAYIWGLIIVAIIEISAVKIIDGVWGFFPIWDGIIFLFINIGPVFINAVPGWLLNLVNTEPVNETIKDYTSNNTANISTVINNTR